MVDDTNMTIDYHFDKHALNKYFNLFIPATRTFYKIKVQ